MFYSRNIGCSVQELQSVGNLLLIEIQKRRIPERRPQRPTQNVS